MESAKRSPLVPVVRYAYSLLLGQVTRCSQDYDDRVILELDCAEPVLADFTLEL